MEAFSLDEMKRTAKSVSYRTVLKNCRGLIEWALSVGYEKSTRIGSRLTLRNDWHVGYYKGTWKGRPCFFVQWSGIEHIWTR